jgi:hypothetical protein
MGSDMLLQFSKKCSKKKASNIYESRGETNKPKKKKTNQNPFIIFWLSTRTCHKNLAIWNFIFSPLQNPLHESKSL